MIINPKLSRKKKHGLDDITISELGNIKTGLRNIINDQ